MKKTAQIEYFEYWVIRVVKDNNGDKKVVREIEFETCPKEEDIVNVLVTCNNNEFVSVIHNYSKGRIVATNNFYREGYTV